MDITEEAIATVLSLMHEDFESAGIMSERVRRDLVIRLLTEEDIISEAVGKYDVIKLVEGSDCVQAVMNESVGHPVHLYVFLTADEQLSLTRNNRDVRLIFEGGGTMAHALAFAQRVIDTCRCLRYCGKNSGEIMDIGGNYASHCRAGRICHSCTLLDTVREHHRHTERNAVLYSEFSKIDNLNYCTGGTQHCNHQATQSISVHVMPDIPWEDWPNIMDRHGLSYHIGVFHYDPVMLTQTRGKLEGTDMYFSKTGDDVTFHFEMDSSLDYVHKWSNFVKYLSPWCQISESSPYAYVYDIKTIAGGVLTAEIFRVPKNSIGRQVKKPFHAYTANETVVKVNSVIYDIDSNLPPDDPAAYIPVEVIVDSDMYKFMLMYGVANDTANVNKPMDISEFRSMLMVYNHTRKFGEITLSARKTIKGLGMEYVINALYHVVVRERSMLESKSKAFTRAMMAKQRLPSINWLTIMTMVPIIPFAAPLLFTGAAFSYYVDKFTNALKRVAAGNAAPYEVAAVNSYTPLNVNGYGSKNGYVHDSKFSFNRIPYKLDKPGLALTAEEFDVQLRKAVAEPADSASNGTTLVGSSLPVIERVDGDLEVDTGVVEELRPELFDDVGGKDLLNEHVREVFSDAFQTYSVNIGGGDQWVKQHLILPVEEVHKDYKDMMLEFAVYSLDCANGVLSTLKRDCAYYAPGGQVHQVRISDMNAATDVGAKIFEVQDTMMALAAAKYMVGVNPLDLKVHYIKTSPSGRNAYVDDVTIRYLYVDNSVKIFNQLIIGRNTLKSMRSNWTPKFPIKLIDGIPSCGKTTEIVSKFTVTSAMVCTVKHSKDDSLLRLLREPRFAECGDLIKSRVRTSDSVVMNGFRTIGKVDVLYVDEGLMMFPGQFYAVCERIRPVRVEVFGDSYQIKAIDRSPSLGVLKYGALKLWTDVEYRNEGLTIAADVTALLKKYVYKRDIYTRSPVRRSLHVNHQPSQDAPCFTVADPSVDYLSVLVGDKNKLLSNKGFVDGKKMLQDAIEGCGTGNSSLNARAFTVHEAQGQRMDKVAITRMNPQTCDVLDSMQHLVVALSRHSYMCTYNTVVGHDKLTELMLSELTEEEIDSVMLPSPDWLVAKIDKLKST